MSDDDDDGPRQPAREALWQRLAVGAVALSIRLVGALPTWVAYPVGILMAVPWFLFWSIKDRRGRRTSGYWRNVRIAFRPGSPLGERRPNGHLWRWSKHIAWLAIDFCRMHRLTQANVHAHCDLAEYPRIAAVFAQQKGLIFATGHIGVWDVSGYAAGLLGLPLTSVFRPSPLPALNRLIERLRTGSGQTVVARKNVLRTLLRVLGDKQAVGILADGGGKHSAVEAPFLGTSSRTVASPALLHLATGAPIVVVAVLRTGWMRYRLRVLDVVEHAATGDRDADMLAITARINRGLTQGIREAPEQWFWQSRRFRHRPAGEVPGPDGLPPLAK
ncbi:MAG: lysophospholipid acyltransferase family protein [Planctomycetes bacterium]|nr:lysophospholipid acyltransferase family protein [Planctomycetota bacterium]